MNQKPIRDLLGELFAIKTELAARNARVCVIINRDIVRDVHVRSETIKKVREITGLGLRDAKSMIERVKGVDICIALNAEVALRLHEFEALGHSYEILT